MHPSMPTAKIYSRPHLSREFLELPLVFAAKDLIASSDKFLEGSWGSVRVVIVTIWRIESTKAFETLHPCSPFWSASFCLDAAWPRACWWQNLHLRLYKDTRLGVSFEVYLKRLQSLLIQEWSTHLLTHSRSVRILLQRCGLAWEVSSSSLANEEVFEQILLLPLFELLLLRELWSSE